MIGRMKVPQYIHYFTYFSRKRLSVSYRKVLTHKNTRLPNWETRVKLLKEKQKLPDVTCLRVSKISVNLVR